mgnify:FL=1
MNVREIAPNIYWVGVVDWDARYFHGHALSTHRGTTYNAYLIVDEKITLVDTVYTPVTQKLLENIREIVDPAKLDYIVCNHSEIDHSGAMPAIVAAAPNAKIYCTKKASEFLEAQFHGGWEYNIVKSFDELSLGKRTLTFLEAPMLHWPDSMFTYIKEDAILMPNDAFGQHYASSGRFDDEVDVNEMMEEASKYYANILNPFSALVAKKLKEVADLGLPIKMICPSHGVIHRENPGRILEAYQRWSTGPAEDVVVIAYDTMWGSTQIMAEAIASGVEAAGVPYKLYLLPFTDRNDVIDEILRAKAVAIGSATINRGLLPTVTPLLDDLVGLRLAGKKAVAFGSDGWGGGAVAAINGYLDKAGMKRISDGVAMRWKPNAAARKELQEVGRQLAESIKE